MAGDPWDTSNQEFYNSQEAWNARYIGNPTTYWDSVNQGSSDIGGEPGGDQMYIDTQAYEPSPGYEEPPSDYSGFGQGDTGQNNVPIGTNPAIGQSAEEAARWRSQSVFGTGSGGGSAGGGGSRGGGGSLGGYGSSSSDLSRNWTTSKEQYQPPEMYDPNIVKPTLSIPGYTGPEYSQTEIDRMTQQKAAPGLRRMRSKMQKVAGQYYENPNVKKMTLREALAGYGEGIESVMGGATTAAETSYAREYSAKSDAAIRNWQAQTQQATLQYQKDWEDYTKQYTKVTTRA